MKAPRVGTSLAFTCVILAAVLAAYLHDALPFTATAPVALGGKFLENHAERWRSRPDGAMRPPEDA